MKEWREKYEGLATESRTTRLTDAVLTVRVGIVQAYPCEIDSD